MGASHEPRRAHDVTLRSNYIPSNSSAIHLNKTHINAMALVNYSDSEGSDTEAPPAAPAQKAVLPTKPKLINRTESKKIKVELPQIRPEPGQESTQEPVAKRARTAGAFSGFNSLLPAPKRSGQNAPKPGVSLKTSSEAAFSRTPVPVLPDYGASEESNTTNGTGGDALPVAEEKKEEEPKIVGRPTRFMPLSVANARKKKPRPKVPVVDKQDAIPSDDTQQTLAQANTKPPAEEPPKSKPKASLFSFGGEDTAPVENSSAGYTPEFAGPVSTSTVQEESDVHQAGPAAPTSNPNKLSDIAADLDLTPAQRRQLFGRKGANADNIAHFNMDAEYRSNQEMAAAGETFEHRQVKAIAPGKHSLQQLVNNVKSQTDALEDKWAEGRRNRGEGGSKYGF